MRTGRAFWGCGVPCLLRCPRLRILSNPRFLSLVDSEFVVGGSMVPEITGSVGSVGAVVG